MMLMAAALAPSVPRKGPLMLAPPSYVMSAKRLTRPMVNTNRKAATRGFKVLCGIDSTLPALVIRWGDSARCGRSAMSGKRSIDGQVPRPQDQQKHQPQPHGKIRARFVHHA